MTVGQIITIAICVVVVTLTIVCKAIEQHKQKKEEKSLEEEIQRTLASIDTESDEYKWRQVGNNAWMCLLYENFYCAVEKRDGLWVGSFFTEHPYRMQEWVIRTEGESTFRLMAFKLYIYIHGREQLERDELIMCGIFPFLIASKQTMKALKQLKKELDVE